MPKKERARPSPSSREPKPLQDLQKINRVHAAKIIKMIEKAHRNAAKSKLRFDGPLNPADPRSVAIHRFKKDLKKWQDASRKVIVWAK